MFNLNGKKIFITGGSGGIGKAITEALLEQGANVMISGTNIDKLNDYKQSLDSSLSKNLNVIAYNLNDLDGIAGLIDQVHETLGGLDVLIANAGVTKDQISLRMKLEDWNEVISVNLSATFLLNQSAIKKMIKQKSGSIINISSVVAFSGNVGQANYVAAKAGVVGMTKTLAQEVASKNIRVNNIAPGYIETPMTDKINDKVKEYITGSIPMKRIGKPDDIVGAVIYLGSDSSQYVTGQTLHVNGGLVMF